MIEREVFRPSMLYVVRLWSGKCAWIVWCVLGLLAPTVAAPANEVAIEIGSLHDQLVRAPAMFQRAPTDRTLAQLSPDAYQPLTDDDVNQGISDQAFWIRLRLRNSSDRPVRWVLSHETTYLDRLTVHWSDNGGPRQVRALTDRAVFANRSEAYRTLAFAHATPATGYTDLILRLSNDKPDSVSLNLHLAEASVFAAQSRQTYAVYGLYYGALLVLVFVSLAAAWMLRQWVYFHYALFLVASGLMWALLNGLAYQYLWPQAVFWHNEGFHILYLLMAAAAFQFSRSFLFTRQGFPWIDRLIRVGQAVMLAGVVLRFAGVYLPVLVLSYVSLVSLVLLAPLGFMAYRRGQVYARWYALAWVIYGVGLTLSVISASTRWLPWGMESLAFAQAAGVLEALLLLVALGERLSGWDRDRRLALRLAQQDPLTGLTNRRGLVPAYEAFRERYAQTQVPVYLILIDLDYFKNVNDTYGHEAGDRVLVALASLMSRVSRPADVCIRYGGEEFVILLQAPSEDVALDIAERMRQDFAGQPTGHGGCTIQHTLTAGLSPVFSANGQLSLKQALQQADQALYQAKRAGRNQCRAYRPAAQALPRPTRSERGVHDVD